MSFSLSEIWSNADSTSDVHVLVNDFGMADLLIFDELKAQPPKPFDLVSARAHRFFFPLYPTTLQIRSMNS